MPSEKFLAEYSELDAQTVADLAARWFTQAYLPETRRMALEMLWERLYSTLPANETEEEELLQVADFVDQTPEPPSMIAEGMLAPNTLMLVTGKPKAGKTFFMLQIADDVASGRPLLGRFHVPKPGPVVYFAMEGSKYKWKHRLTQKGMGDRNPPVFIYTGRKDFSTREGVEWLIKKVAPINPVLIIVDTVRQALNMEETNNADKVNARMRPLVDAVQQRGDLKLPDGCCVILVHHNNKNALAEGGDKISGSNALQSNSDGYIIIDDHKRIANGNLQGKAQCEARIDTVPDFVWEMDTESYEVKILGADDAVKAEIAARQSSVERYFPQIARAIFDGDKDGTTFAEILTRTGLNRSLAHKTIKAMMEKSCIKIAGERPSKRGAPASLYINCSNTVIGEQLNNDAQNEADERSQNMVNDFLPAEKKDEPKWE